MAQGLLGKKSDEKRTRDGHALDELVVVQPGSCRSQVPLRREIERVLEMARLGQPKQSPGAKVGVGSL